MSLRKLKKLCCTLRKTFRWTLIADDDYTAGYRCNIQFIDLLIYWFISINRLQYVFQGSKSNTNVTSPYFFQFVIMPETAMKVTKDSVTIKELKDWWGHEGQTVQLKDADPNELQLFIEKIPVPIKGEKIFKICLSFGFGLKRYMVEPLYKCTEKSRSRLIWWE